MGKLVLIINQWLASVTRRLHNSFYLYLSALLTVFILLDAGVFHIGENMRDKTFDLMVKNRIIVPQPDKDIIIVDINEASLSAMAEEYGRWPWPRQVMGEFLENIQAQQPKTVVFDILFSDPDVFNPDSDAYFNEVIAGTDNTFFPMLRLAPESDALSQVTPNMIPGIEYDPADPAKAPPKDQPKTVAIVLPHFEAALNSGHLGTHNIYPDKDGIVREYRLWHDESGWILPSLPLAVGNFASLDVQDMPQNILMNWRGKPFTYQFVSFSDVYTDMASQVKKRPADEFKDKIVIIGSTAPSLFDLKATAMAKAHPGVEIMATAIDNVKHQDYLKVWRGKIPYILLSLTLVWLTALAFFKNVDRDKLIKVFGSSQIILLAFSFLIINLTNSYLDFAGPIIWAVMYFSVAKIYALANDRAMQKILASEVESGKRGSGVLLMPIAVESQLSLTDGIFKKFRQKIELSLKLPATVDSIKGTQSGIWGLFTDLVVVSWAYDSQNTESAAQANQDAENLSRQLLSLLQSAGAPSDARLRYAIHTGVLHIEKPTANQWRGLFAQAIIKLDILEKDA